jgi:hypothetical protein
VSSVKPAKDVGGSSTVKLTQHFLIFDFETQMNDWAKALRLGV